MFLRGLCRRPTASRLHFPSLAYASTTFAKTLIDSVFKFYYVKVFLIRYQVSDYWFNVAQVVFMIWNAINDPLFGYIQDNSTSSILRVRRKSILYGAPLFVLSFLTFWFPWTSSSSSSSSSLVGLHLVVSLCFYDALYTFVLLAQCALFAEMSTHHEDRLRLVLYDQLASLLGSWSVGLCEFSSSSLLDYPTFQLTTVFIAFISWIGFSITGIFAKTEIAQMKPKDKESPPVKEDMCGLTSSSSSSSLTSSSSSASSSIWRQTWEILRQRNFLCFVFTNFLQIFHVTFYANFASIFLDILFPAPSSSSSPSSSSLSSSSRSLFNGSLFVLPQLLVLCLGPWLRTKGAFWVVMRSFYAKIAAAAFIGLLTTFSLLSASNLRLVLLVFVAVDFASGNAIFATFNLLVSDVIDDDMRVNKRSSPLSSSVFGTNALITKPAISLAPMLVLFLLNPFGFQEFKVDPKAFVASASSASRLASLQWVSLTLIWAWPLAVGLLQICVFSPYSLRNTHESMIAKHVET